MRLEYTRVGMAFGLIIIWDEFIILYYLRKLSSHELILFGVFVCSKEKDKDGKERRNTIGAWETQHWTIAWVQPVRSAVCLFVYVMYWNEMPCNKNQNRKKKKDRGERKQASSCKHTWPHCLWGLSLSRHQRRRNLTLSWTMTLWKYAVPIWTPTRFHFSLLYLFLLLLALNLDLLFSLFPLGF